MAFKAFDGLLELALGILLFVFGPNGISRAAVWLTHEVSSDNMRSWLSDHLVRHTHAIGASSVEFAGVYLLVQGVVKLALAVALLREIRQLFPIGLGIMGLLVVSIGVEEVRHPSWGLHVLLVLNLLITFLIWREYVELKEGRLR